jgi:hypothetical protein
MPLRHRIATARPAPPFGLRPNGRLRHKRCLPGTLGWLYEYGGMAVQVFLVIAGFLAARGLSDNGQALTRSPLAADLEALPAPGHSLSCRNRPGHYCAAIADHWMDDEAIPARATLANNGWPMPSCCKVCWATTRYRQASGTSPSTFQLFALMAILLWAAVSAYLAPGLGAAGRHQLAVLVQPRCQLG